jgi:hypothetical protein
MARLLAGDVYCYGVDRSTHRAAAGLLVEIATKSFSHEADTLDSGENLLWAGSPEGSDAERNAQAAALLAKARASYADGIRHIEAGLEALGA